MPDNVSFLFAAFTVVWLLIAGYFFFLNSRISGLRQDVEALRDELAARTASGEPDAARGARGE
ncbi:MAG: CcmD family protein [Thermomicrobiales bacterium]|jgi:CcmD family protein|nr:CcmD family protein [Thermomicrobiales bacterium]